MQALNKLRSFTPQRRAWWMACVWVLASAAGIYAEENGLFTYFERYFQQMRMLSVGGTAQGQDGKVLRDWTRENIVLVTLSDAAFEPKGAFGKLGSPPLPRSYHARLLNVMRRLGARVVAFDFIFDLSRPQDAEFAAAAKQFGPVVWGEVPSRASDGTPFLIQPVSPLLEASPLLGHAVLPQDKNEPEVSSLDLFNGGEPAFSVEIAKAALGIQSDLHQKDGKTMLAEVPIPLDRRGRMPIIFFGEPAGNGGSPFPVVPYETALEADKTEVLKSFFKDKVVIVGDTTMVGNDFRITPVGYMAGMEIHANAVATLMRGLQYPGEFVREAGLPWRIGIIVCLSGLACALCSFAPLLRAALGVLAGSAAYFYASTLAFTTWRVETPLLATWFAIFLGSAILIIHRGLVEERAKLEARRHLRRFLSPQVAEYVLNNPEKCALGGERVTATVLFSDIRDFTPLAEQLSGLEVVELLNEFLTEMTGKIIEHEGTLDKFIGDAIMAFWGAPVRHEDHAWRAVSTALDMATALDALQDQWEARALPRVEIGIGINSGEMVIGEMGAQARRGMEERKDFTAIGDAVNLASRVEGLNKSLSTRILITEATYRLVKYHVLVHGPFEAQVKGKRDTIMVYEPYARKPLDDE